MEAQRRYRKYQIMLSRVFGSTFSLCIYWNRVIVRVTLFNATFNNISCISWRSILLVEEPRVTGEDHRPDKLYHIMLYISSTPHLSENRTHNLVLMSTVYIGRSKSNYHMMTTTTTPCYLRYNYGIHFSLLNFLVI